MSSFAQESCKQAMKMVDGLFLRRRIAAALVKAGTHAALDGFDNRFVLQFDFVQRAARALAEFGLVPNVTEVRNLRAVNGERLDDVDGDAPRIKIEHRIGEQPEVVARDSLTVIGRRAREI